MNKLLTAIAIFNLDTFREYVERKAISKNILELPKQFSYRFDGSLILETPCTVSMIDLDFLEKSSSEVFGRIKLHKKRI